MSTPNRHSGHSGVPSDLTLTPGLDGSSDYQQYLEKTSRKDSSIHSKPGPESSYVNSPPPTATTTNRGDTHLLAHAHSESAEIQPAAAATRMFEEIKPAGQRKGRKRRRHRVEAVEDPHEYPGSLALTLLTIGICLSVFLVSLDRTIVATVSYVSRLES